MPSEVEMEIIYCEPGLRLRPFSNTDIETAKTWYADPVVLQGAISPNQKEPLSLEILQAMYADLSSRGELYIIEVDRGHEWQPIGEVMLSMLSLPVVIGESAYRGQRIAKRVVQTLIARAKEKGWSKMNLKGIYKGNVSSQRLFESCGFVRVGENDRCWIYELSLNQPSN